MAIRSFIVDSGAVSRLAKRLFIVDSGGTARAAQRIFVVDSGNVARQIYVNDVLNISDQGINDSAIGGPAFAAYLINNTGTVQYSKLSVSGGTPQFLENWITPQTNMANYSIRCHVNSGTAPTGDTLDSDLSLGTSRSWTLTQSSGVGSKTCNLTLTLKRISDGATMDTATVTLTATWS